MLITLQLTCIYCHSQYKAAGNSIQQRHELLSACAKQIEKEMIMLGAIGIEDELQDGVPEVRHPT